MKEEIEVYIDHLFVKEGARVVCYYCGLDKVEYETMGADIKEEAREKCALVYYELERIQRMKSAPRRAELPGQLNIFK